MVPAEDELDPIASPGSLACRDAHFFLGEADRGVFRVFGLGFGFAGVARFCAGGAPAFEVGGAFAALGCDAGVAGTSSASGRGVDAGGDAVASGCGIGGGGAGVLRFRSSPYFSRSASALARAALASVDGVFA
jgi:hypothetical protein